MEIHELLTKLNNAGSSEEVFGILYFHGFRHDDINCKKVIHPSVTTDDALLNPIKFSYPEAVSILIESYVRNFEDNEEVDDFEEGVFEDTINHVEVICR